MMALCPALREQRGTKRERNSVSPFHVSFVVHTVLTISLNLLTALPGRWWYLHVNLTGFLFISLKKKKPNSLIGVLL